MFYCGHTSSRILTSFHHELLFCIFAVSSGRCSSPSHLPPAWSSQLSSMLSDFLMASKNYSYTYSFEQSKKHNAADDRHLSRRVHRAVAMGTKNSKIPKIK